METEGNGEVEKRKSWREGKVVKQYVKKRCLYPRTQGNIWSNFMFEATCGIKGGRALVAGYNYLASNINLT